MITDVATPSQTAVAPRLAMAARLFVPAVHARQIVLSAHQRLEEISDERRHYFAIRAGGVQKRPGSPPSSLSGASFLELLVPASPSSCTVVIPC
jgi:hypothetical protein